MNVLSARYNPSHLRLMICVRTVVAERRVSVRGRLRPEERLSTEAELRRSASDTDATMLSDLFGLWPFNQRPVHDLRRKKRKQLSLSHSQEDSRRQNQQSHLQRSATYVYKKHRFCARRLSVERYSYSDVAGWVAGWLAGWLSHSGIVSKRLNLSENFFDHVKAPSF